jgi:hypothetical protein
MGRYGCQKLLVKVMAEKQFSEKNYKKHFVRVGASYKGKLPDFSEISVFIHLIF